MIWEAWITLGVVLLMLLVLIKNLAPADMVLTATAVAFVLLSSVSEHFPGASDMAHAFGNDALVTVGVLFVVAAGLTETGGMALVVNRMLGRPKSVFAAQLRLLTPVTTASAFLNNTPVVAMFVPVVQDWCKRTGIAPSKLFIPLSYAAVLGGLCTLIGTSTNLVVQGLLIEAGEQPMGMFTISMIGIPVALVGMLFLLTASRWLLPERGARKQEAEDARSYTAEMMVEPKSSIDGLSIEQAGLRHLPGLYLTAIERGGDTLVAVGPEQILRGSDRLFFVGVVGSVVDLQKIRGLVPATNQVHKLTEPRSNRVLVETVLSDSCPLVGKSVREGRFRNRYDAAIIAVHRNGERIEGKIGDIVLRAGDTLLIETHPRFVEAQKNNRDFLLISGVPDSEPRRHSRAWLSIGILLAMVGLASFENVTGISMLTAAFGAAALMLLTGCCSVEQARRALDFPVLLSIASALIIGKTMQTSGAAEALAEELLKLSAGTGEIGVLAGVYLFTLLLTELITNNAAAVLAFPIAKAAAVSLGYNFMPFAICICIAASAGFATPLGYQTHLMVYNVGGYRFSDFIKIGVPLDLLCMLVTVLALPLAFPLV